MARTGSAGAAAGVMAGAAGGLIAVGVVLALALRQPAEDEPPVQPAPAIGAADAGRWVTDRPDAPPGAAGAPAPETAPAAPATAAPLFADAATGDRDVIAFEDASLAFEAVLPAEGASALALADLRRETDDYLASMLNRAAAAAALASSGGMQWTVDIVWRRAAAAGGLESYIGQLSEFTGGAHPAHAFDTRIVRADGERIRFASLFAGGAMSPAFMIAGCEQLKRQKRERIGEETVFGEPIVCNGRNANAGLDEAPIALAASDQPGKFGGALVFLAPYAAGAYAEGAYVLAVPHETFAADLRPEFAELFGGSLVAPD